MSVAIQPEVSQVPKWVVAEMPPGYRTRLLEIERLSADLHAMDRIGCVLWETGAPLRDGIAGLFGALKCEVNAGPAGPIDVTLGEPGRLVLLVSDATARIERTHEELAAAFQATQFAGARDRVVFVANNDPGTPPADRPEPISPDALAMLERIGVAVVTTVTLFRLWRLWLEDQPKGRKALEQLHAQDGGLFTIPPR